MATKETIYFSPEQHIPEGLVGAVVGEAPVQVAQPEADDSFDPQMDSLLDDWSETDSDDADETMAAPGMMVVLEQEIHTSPEGAQVVDAVIDVEEIEGAIKYEVRVTRAS